MDDQNRVYYRCECGEVDYDFLAEKCRKCGKARENEDDRYQALERLKVEHEQKLQRELAMKGKKYIG
jgi:hypothetical protein